MVGCSFGLEKWWIKICERTFFLRKVIFICIKGRDSQNDIESSINYCTIHRSVRISKKYERIKSVWYQLPDRRSRYLHWRKGPLKLHSLNYSTTVIDYKQNQTIVFTVYWMVFFFPTQKKVKWMLKSLEGN